jgi:hypothetical protein
MSNELFDTLQPMACGNCGHGSFAVSCGHRSELVKLYVKCLKCDAVTTIAPKQPEPVLVIDWAADNQSGVLCRMEPKTS